MKIKDVIFENDDADDMFAPSERSLRSLNRATFQQRIPAMIRSAYDELDAQTGWFPIHLARDIGQSASELYQDTEVYTLADQMIRQDIMPVIGNIVHLLDAEDMQHQDNLVDALVDSVESIQSNSDLGAHIGALHEAGHISPDEYYECYHDIERHIADLLTQVIYNAYVSTKITDVAEGSLNEDAVMGKIEQSGQIVRILKKQHTVPFSSDKDWLLIDTDPAKGNKGLGIKWVPATTRFEWVRPYRDTVDENFIDGRHPEDKGDAKRHGINTKASVSSLRKTAKSGGRKGQLAHWLANMKAGRAKANKK